MSDPIVSTSSFWQRLDDHATVGGLLAPPFVDRFPARLPDGRFLVLPLRRLPDDPERAVASFLANQASFGVVDALAAHMSDAARDLAPELIVGLPTLGLTFAPLVAARLGFERYVPLGYSRKYWYDEALSVPVRSITTPDASRRLYLDPHLRALAAGRRVLLVDDAVSTGGTAAAALALLRGLGAEVAGLVVAMLQGERWRARLAQIDPGAAGRVRGVFASPGLRAGGGGWWPEG